MNKTVFKNFGFMNGANKVGLNIVHDTTSYDYDAPLSECGQYTAKYNATREMIASYDPLYDILRFSPAESDR